MPDVKRSLHLSRNAVTSVKAVLRGTPGRTEAEKEYDESVKGAKRLAGHRQRPLPKGFVGKRLYTITTIAASARYGGTRTVAVCDSLARAREIVKSNEGDIFECSYLLAVIEAIACNCLYPQVNPSEQYWFRWEGDSRTGRYLPIKTPPGYENTFGFGVG